MQQFLNGIEVEGSGVTYPDGTTQLRAAPSKNNPLFFTDFLIPTGISDPWQGSVHAGGTVSSPATSYYTGQNQGLIQIKSSASANSGYIYRIGSAEILISGYEATNLICMFTSNDVNIVGRYGFGDTATTGSPPTDGNIFIFAGNGTDMSVSGYNYSNSSSSNVSLGTVALNTFYHFRITVNSTATSVLFEIFDIYGTLVASNSLTTNIPSGSNRNTGHMAQFFHTAGSAGLGLVILDYMDFSFPMRHRGAL